MTKQQYICADCGDHVDFKRAKLGYRVCLACGDDRAIEARKYWTVAPVHKSNYMLVTDRSLLKGLNNKGGNVK